MNPEEFNEEIALQHASDMLETGSSFEEVGVYLQGKGLEKPAIDRLIATAAQEPLRKQFKNRIIYATIGLLAGLAFYVFALYLQHQQEEQIRQLIEQGKGVDLPNGQFVMLSNPDEHVLPGRIAVFSAIFGLFSAFGAFRTWQLLKSLKNSLTK
ncbi:MAG: hypothetical protein KA165_12810 [Saprospiraceae bacterium]|nr:hypothetical protein [Saprospiraceae bacterium]